MNMNRDLEPFVLSFFRSGKPFTSLDIANAAKYSGLFYHNRQVAEWLRSNTIPLAHKYGYLYNQTLIRVDSKKDGNTLAYLYHHYLMDPDEYLDRDQNPQPFNTPKSPFSSNKPSVVKKVPHWVNQKRDALGRFCK